MCAQGREKGINDGATGMRIHGIMLVHPLLHVSTVTFFAWECKPVLFVQQGPSNLVTSPGTTWYFRILASCSFVGLPPAVALAKPSLLGTNTVASRLGFRDEPRPVDLTASQKVDTRALRNLQASSKLV